MAAVISALLDTALHDTAQFNTHVAVEWPVVWLVYKQQDSRSKNLAPKAFKTDAKGHLPIDLIFYHTPTSQFNLSIIVRLISVKLFTQTAANNFNGSLQMIAKPKNIKFDSPSEGVPGTTNQAILLKCKPLN